MAVFYYNLSKKLAKLAHNLYFTFGFSIGTLE